MADISDLSPPDSPDAEEAVAEFEQAEAPEEHAPAEPEDDLDFSNLDMDFDIGDTSGSDNVAAVSAEGDQISANKSTSSMDEELNFDLDLGGLSIHEDGKS